MKPLTALELGQAMYDHDPARFPLSNEHLHVAVAELTSKIRLAGLTKSGVVQYLPYRSADMVEIFEG